MVSRKKKYSTYIKVMVTPEQKKLINKEAEKLGLTDSDVVRLLVNTLNKEPLK